MQVKELISILEKCDENDEITFIFDENPRFSWDRGHGLHEVSMIHVTGFKINGKIPLTNGSTHHIIEEDAPTIFKMEESEMKERRFMTEREAKGEDYTFCYDCNHFYGDRKSTRLNSSHRLTSRMPSSA